MRETKLVRDLREQGIELLGAEPGAVTACHTATGNTMLICWDTDMSAWLATCIIETAVKVWQAAGCPDTQV